MNNPLSKIDLLALPREEALRILAERSGGKLSYGGGGYAAQPGTGPEGETCKTCKHLRRKSLAKVYLKCELMRPVWTGGAKTDIKAKSPACAKWEAQASSDNDQPKTEE